MPGAWNGEFVSLFLCKSRNAVHAGVFLRSPSANYSKPRKSHSEMASRVLKLAVATCITLFSIQGLTQTSTSCDPTKADCPPDLALSENNVYDFTESASPLFPAFGPVTYGSNGAVFTISKSGDSPTITSKWYIMFGKVSVVLKAAPGTGIVSSLVLESDDLDEIDYEWLGSDAGEVQSNYFGKGVTGSYNRGGTHPNPTSQSSFNAYTVEWTAQQITWSINNQVVRILTPDQAIASGNSYPQTPMRIKIGAWSAGDPSNAPGTIAWAGGNTNYAAGPYSMYVQNVSVSDYSRGTQYEYSDRSGTYQSIRVVNGSVNTSSNGNNASAVAYNSGVSVPVPFATGGAVMAPNSTSWNTTIVTMTVSMKRRQKHEILMPGRCTIRNADAPEHTPIPRLIAQRRHPSPLQPLLHP